MNKEIELAFKWLENRHQALQELAASGEKFNSDYMHGHTEGLKSAVKYYNEEITRIRALLDGFMIDDVKFGGEENVG